jgi:hypothetical protein
MWAFSGWAVWAAGWFVLLRIEDWERSQFAVSQQVRGVESPCSQIEPRTKSENGEQQY